MRCIDEFPREMFEEQFVLVRAGLDVPLDAQGKVSDMFRVRRASETLLFLRERGARVIVLSHIGRDPSETNAPVAEALKQFVPLLYVPEIFGHAVESARKSMNRGDILLLENLRRDPGEAANDAAFAKQLAAYGSYYVDDAFSVAHRAHASIVGIPRVLPGYAGLLMRDEIRALTAARSPRAPSLAILGGAKFETKAPLIKLLLEQYDHVFIAGALANDIFKARGMEVGRSLISKELPAADILNHPRLIAPVDVTAQMPDGRASMKLVADVTPDEKIVDIGPDTVALLAPLLADAAYTLWNGPTGLYEEGFTGWTEQLARMISARVVQGALSVIGGGDTIAAIEGAHIPPENLGFLSTGGGAMLDYVLNGTLPGIEVLD